jgi:hypothetical protein
MRSNRQIVKSNKDVATQSARPLKNVFAAFLIKLAKHMSLLACLMIVGAATGRSNVTEVGIFLIVITAAVMYSIGRTLERRVSALIRLPRGDP